jgi:hypothetical protein
MELIAMFALGEEEHVPVAPRVYVPDAPFPRPPNKRTEQEDSSADEADSVFTGPPNSLLSGSSRSAALATKAPKGEWGHGRWRGPRWRLHSV